MGDQVRLSVPASPAYLVLVRLLVSTVSSRLDIGIDAIEDLSLAVDELCLLLLQGDSFDGVTLELGVEWTDVAVTVRCQLDEPPGSPVRVSLTTNPISIQILDALTDAHGVESDGVKLSAWLTKNREQTKPSP